MEEKQEEEKDVSPVRRSLRRGKGVGGASVVGLKVVRRDREEVRMAALTEEKDCLELLQIWRHLGALWIMTYNCKIKSTEAF